MVILVDTNIILDVIASREPFVTESRKILELCAKQEIKGYIAVSYTHLTLPTKRT